jgi:hypothetical protein
VLGSECFVDDDPRLQLGTGPFALMAVVAVYGTGTRPLSLFHKEAGTPAFGIELSVDNTANLLTGLLSPSSAPSTVVHATISSIDFHAVIARGPALEIRVDGVATTGTTSTVDVSAKAGSVTIGAVGGVSLFSLRQMYVAELIVVKGTLTDAQVEGVEDYFRDRYKFAW